MRILRLLSSRPLACGCVAGIYETYGGPIVWIVDAREPQCHNPKHRPGARLSGAEGGDTPGAPRMPSPGWVR